MTEYKFIAAEIANSRSKAHEIARYKAACELFAESPDMGGAQVCGIIAEVLHNVYNMTYDEIDAIEAEAYTMRGE